MSRPLKYGLLILMLLLLGSLPLAMQLQTGSIEGVVRNDYDPVGKVLVEARNLASGAIFRTESDPAGHYKLDKLRPGRYSLSVEAPGRDSTWVRQVILERGDALRSDMQVDRPVAVDSRL